MTVLSRQTRRDIPVVVMTFQGCDPALVSVTAEEVYKRLRARSDATSDEQLAHELGTTTRSIARLKIGKGPQFATAVRFLEKAGLLRLPAEADAIAAAEKGSPDDRLLVLAAAVGEMVEANRTLHARLLEVEQQLLEGRCLGE